MFPCRTHASSSQLCNNNRKNLLRRPHTSRSPGPSRSQESLTEPSILEKSRQRLGSSAAGPERRFPRAFKLRQRRAKSRPKQGIDPAKARYNIWSALTRRSLRPAEPWVGRKSPCALWRRAGRGHKRPFTSTVRPQPRHRRSALTGFRKKNKNEENRMSLA